MPPSCRTRATTASTSSKALMEWKTAPVLDNDKGGNAKHIVTVDGLDPALIDDYSINDDGTISVHVVGLDPGVITALEFSYTIQLGNGALSTADVELHIASTESLLANGSFENPAVAPATWTVTNIPGYRRRRHRSLAVGVPGCRRHGRHLPHLRSGTRSAPLTTFSRRQQMQRPE